MEQTKAETVCEGSLYSRSQNKCGKMGNLYQCFKTLFNCFFFFFRLMSIFESYTKGTHEW